MQNVSPLRDAYQTEGLKIIRYSLESDAGLRPRRRRPEFLKQIRVRTIPANFILDKNGVVLAKNLHGEALTAFVKNYLEEGGAVE